jgi:LPS export ABC transporter protein LptC
LIPRSEILRGDNFADHYSMNSLINILKFQHSFLLTVEVRNISLVALYVLIVGLLCSSCTDDNSQSQKDTILKDEPSNTIWDFSMRMMDSNKTKSYITSRRARLYNDKQESYLDTNVVVEFMGSDGKRSAILTCDSAHIDNRTNNMWAKGNVVVVSDSSRTKVQTSLMLWDNTARKLYSDKYVRIQRPGELIEGGIGFESDEYLRNYRIYQVKGTKSP